MVTPRDLPDILQERELSQRAIDRWGGLSTSYQSWHGSISALYNLYAGNWPSVGPDRKVLTDKARVPDYVRLAAEDRARAVAASRPALVCRPPQPGDRAQAAADKRERIVGAWWDNSRVIAKTARWAFDSMFSGLVACKVWPDFTGRDRFPKFHRIEPAYMMPDPIFAEGPWLDSCVVSYQEHIRTLKTQYPNAPFLPTRDANARARVIEYYDGRQIVKVARYPGPNQREAEVTLLYVNHKLDRCPVVIGTRPTADGLYHGEFDNAVALLEFANQWATMMLDDAINKTYPEVKIRGEVNRESGPGGEVYLETAADDYEYVQQPNQPFSNLQLFRDLTGGVRASVMLPPARSGDPNESVISAAGISAAGAQWLQAVASTQNDVLAPMLEAATELAFTADVAYFPNETKVIFGGDSRQRETYVPSKDIADNRRIEVVYGSNAAMDPINRGVYALQQWAGGRGLLSKRRAMEMNPDIQDASREMKEQLVERLTEAGIAGLQQAAAAGALPADVWANIVRAVTDDDMPLHEAVEKYMMVAPVAEPQGQAPTANPASPGVAGAGEPQQPVPTLPPLETLIQV